MFGLGKVVGFLAQPLTWVAMLLALGLVRQVWRGGAAGRRWMVAALLLLLALGWEVPPTLALWALESRHPSPATVPSGLAGMVVLGGATDRGTLAGPGRSMPLNDAAERLTEPLALARAHPSWKVLFTGGDGHLVAAGWTEARMALAFWQQQGLPPSRITLEDRSRNTAENARFAARLPGVDQRAGWLLVTSAWHMPRAVAAFEQAGWKVTPYPVDFRADPTIRWSDYSFTQGPRLWSMAVHEWLGMAALKFQMK